MSAAVLTPAPSAAVRDRERATRVAAFAAVVPTVLAAQGMAAVAVDLLGFNLAAAIALSGFLELALVSSALLARAAALAGRPGGADSVAVWAVSATSGLLSGLHELIDTSTTGRSSWTTEPGDLLAAGLRVIAPLVAAWLWERALHAARAEQAGRTLAEIRRDRRLLDVARAALALRRLEDADPDRTTRRHRRARRRLDRAYLSALRGAPPSTDLGDVLAAVGRVDTLAAATLVPPSAPPAVTAASARHAVTGRAAAATRRPAKVTAQLDGAGQEPRPDALAAPSRAERPTADTVTGRFEAAVAIVREDPDVSGASLATELGRRGHRVSERTGRRLLGRARAVVLGAA